MNREFSIEIDSNKTSITTMTIQMRNIEYDFVFHFCGQRPTYSICI